MSLLNEFCKEFYSSEEELGTVARLGRRCFLIKPAHEELVQEHKRELFGAGIYLGEEKTRFEPSPALVELLAARTTEHKCVVDEKASWLFLCGRDVFSKAVIESDIPSESELLLVQNEQDENLGYGKRVEKGNVVVKNILDRGFFLRRERLK